MLERRRQGQAQRPVRWLARCPGKRPRLKLQPRGPHAKGGFVSSPPGPHSVYVPAVHACALGMHAYAASGGAPSGTAASGAASGTPASGPATQVCAMSFSSYCPVRSQNGRPATSPQSASVLQKSGSLTEHPTLTAVTRKASPTNNETRMRGRSPIVPALARRRSERAVGGILVCIDHRLDHVSPRLRQAFTGSRSPACTSAQPGTCCRLRTAARRSRRRCTSCSDPGLRSPGPGSGSR